MDLVCLPLEQLDIMLGMYWLVFNQVHINCFEKTVIFPEIAKVEDAIMSVKQMNSDVREGAVVFMLCSLTEVKGKAKSGELPVVNEFPEVFLEDVNELPPEREVEFAID